MRFAQAGTQTLFVRLIIIGVAFITGMINARFLGPEGLGVLTLLLLIPNTCFRFGNLGLGSSLSYFTGKKQLSLKSALLISIVTTVVLSLISCTGIYFFARYIFSPWEEVQSNLVLFSLLITPLVFLHNFLQRIVAGLLKITVHNFSEILVSVINLLSLFIFVVFGKMFVMGSLFSFAISEFAVCLYLITFVLTLSKTESILKIDNNASFNTLWTYGKWNYSVLLNNFLFDQIPLFILSRIVPLSQLGLYSVGKNLATRAMIIPDTFTNVLFPYNASGTNEQAIKRTVATIRNFVIAMIIVCLFLFIASKPIIILLYGEQYKETVLLFRIVLPVLVFYPISKLQIVHLASVGLSKKGATASFYSLPIITAIALLLIPGYGIIGACVALSTSYFLLAVISTWYFIKYTKTSFTEIISFTQSDIVIYKNILNKFNPCRIR